MFSCSQLCKLLYIITNIDNIEKRKLEWERIRESSERERKRVKVSYHLIWCDIAKVFSLCLFLEFFFIFAQDFPETKKKKKKRCATYFSLFRSFSWS